MAATPDTQRQWYRASELAKVAMGKTERTRGSFGAPRWNADDDPLAHWCLTEAIMNVGRNVGGNSKDGNT